MVGISNTKRQSATEREIARAAPMPTRQRLAPPSDLSALEKREWLRVVNDNPPEAFQETFAGLLRAYCQHIVQVNKLTQQIAATGSTKELKTLPGLRLYERLVRLRIVESRAALLVATKLRITKQSVSTQDKAGRQQAKGAKQSQAAAASTPTAKRPWE